MRATTAFNKMLAIPGAHVTGVVFTPDGIVVDLGRRAKRLRCPCGWSTRAVYDRSRRSWRGLDLGTAKVFLRASIRRLMCRRCGRVRTEAVPWARPGARFTRDFEDVVAWLAQRMDKSAVTRLLRCSWEAVANIVTRVVAEQLDETRLRDLYRIGVDEVSYRKGHRYLTVVADHDRDGAVVWVGEGKSAATLGAFYEQLGEDGCAQVQAVSMDLGAAFKKATDAHAPTARQCVDPFHLIALANEAINKARRWAWNIERDKARHAAAQAGPKRRGRPPAGSPPPTRDQARWVKHTRWALLKDPEHLNASQLQVLHELRRSHSVLYRCWQLKEGLRDLYRLADPADAPEHLNCWPGPAAAGSPPSSPCPRPSGPTATGSSPPCSSAYPTPSSRASTQDPPDQPSRLRTPQRRRPHRDDLPLLRRTDHPATHTKVRRTAFKA
ncbi:ISL3 family transposase [Intrasporangium calvum]|uniref:Transposase IS204/IS1001/IS1096/IS1165 family protein n=1 Tax=Intrasporangium calvum (strain ATCC 23552 / DSM 43043 / JCM 3097 / NBRC 12989 / NCIMB 10167 / NRRL B-3866 / 7 KIP) TaxID=710696 RepID=E6S7I1_INTC7|nr:ISL3 family transposase [Intrasporangium calvum]ADU46876.1 transposase IS204/IS1001/IS1096/IS1165 family protein [Intrasporangium calvum DSM 43043]